MTTFTKQKGLWLPKQEEDLPKIDSTLDDYFESHETIEDGAGEQIEVDETLKQHAQGFVDGIKKYAKQNDLVCYDAETDTLNLSEDQLTDLVRFSDEYALDHVNEGKIFTSSRTFTSPVVRGLNKGAYEFFKKHDNLLEKRVVEEAKPYILTMPQEAAPRPGWSIFRKAVAAGVMIAVGYFVAGCGDGGGGGGTPTDNPEIVDTFGELSNAPDILPIDTADFWQNNGSSAPYHFNPGQISPLFQFSPEAAGALDNIFNYFAADEIPYAWGVNDSGVVVQIEFQTPTGIYTDTNGNGTDDAYFRFTPANFSGMNQTEQDNMDNALNDLPDKAGMQRLIEEIIQHYKTSSASVYDTPSIGLMITGEYVPGDVVAEYDEGSANVVSIFPIDVVPAVTADLAAEQALNGQMGGTYVWEACMEMNTPANPQSNIPDTSGIVSDVVYQAMKFHEENN